MNQQAAQSILDVPLREARRLLAEGGPVYLCVNPVEYHGPHLSLHNDALICQGLVRDLHARLQESHPTWPLLLAGEVEVGVDVVPGPGSLPVDFRTVRRFVNLACTALADLGARRAVLMTFHGSPLHNLALHYGVCGLRKRGIFAVTPLPLLLRALMEGARPEIEEVYSHITNEAERAEMIRNLSFDFHAGFLETSLTLNYVPGSVKDHCQLAPCPPLRPLKGVRCLARTLGSLGLARAAHDLGYLATALSWYGLRPFPGYTGNPRYATPEAGALLAGALIEEMAPVVEAALEGQGEPPEPVMKWMQWATLNGRIGTISIPSSQISYSA